VLSWGIPEDEALRAATYNPACAIGAESIVGSIEHGKQADFLICSPDYSQRRVFIAGKEIV
jgi:N-acetylglucosamine-6-phosphate deacetylase